VHHPDLDEDTPQPRITLTFIYNVGHIQCGNMTFPECLANYSTFTVTRRYRLGLLIPPGSAEESIILYFEHFTVGEKDVRCCFSDSESEPSWEQFLTEITDAEVKGDAAVLFDKESLEFAGFQLHPDGDNLVILHLQITQKVDSDTWETKEDGSVLHMYIGEHWTGGPLPHYMVDTKGSVLRDYE
jgi:hypothetical protein